MNDTDLQARVREALERTDVMALSTIDDDGGPWTSPVQYQWNSQLNLYFASMPDARHVRNIQHDTRVAVAIYNMPGPRAATSACRSADSPPRWRPAAAATAGSDSKPSRPRPGASTKASTGNVTRTDALYFTVATFSTAGHGGSVVSLRECSRCCSRTSKTSSFAARRTFALGC
jgi:Pyridoxamine 5'-phosphate oxidase